MAPVPIRALPARPPVPSTPGSGPTAPGVLFGLFRGESRRDAGAFPRLRLAMFVSPQMTPVDANGRAPADIGRGTPPNCVAHRLEAS